MTSPSDLSTYIKTEAIDLLCGKYLGGGVARKVYLCSLNPDWVVKCEEASGSFQNVVEWTAWHDWKRVEEVHEWLAPCHFISPCGGVLIQSRVEPLTKATAPKKLPEFLTDTKLANYGWLKGRVVACDYGLIRWTVKTKLKKTNWWGTT